MNEIPVRAVLDQYGLTTTKSLGQNFLKDRAVLEAIAQQAQGANVLEIGAGIGTLTGLLCRGAQRVVTVEIDRHLQPLLTQEVTAPNHQFIWSDILKCDLAAVARQYFEGQKMTVVGNLPYYITTEILQLLYRQMDCWDRAVLMVQREVAQRLLCDVGSKEYRALSVLTQGYCRGQLVLEVPPHCFVPAPHVHSAVLALEPHSRRPDAGFIPFVQSGFAARRKKLCSSASFLQQTHRTKAQVCALLAAAGLPEDARGEAFSPQQWARLYELAQNND